ncbi:hypothetical protein MHBO_003718, partial [Bonamia ostreae]
MNFLEKKKKQREAKKMKKNIREIRRYINRIEREIHRMEIGEKKTMAQLKTAMNKRDDSSTRTIAKQITTARKDRAQLNNTKLYLGNIMNKLQTMQATVNTSEVLENVSKNLK